MTRLRLFCLLGLLGLLLALLPVVPVAAAPAPIIEWTRQFGDSARDGANSVAVDSSADAYVVGHTSGSLPGQATSGAEDAFVRQYHADGSEGWTHQFGSDVRDWALGVAVDAVGDVYVAGWTEGALPGQTSAGGQDAFVRQYHADGSEGWTHQFGTGAWDWATSIAVDPAGNIDVAGWTDATLSGQASAGGQDAFVRQFKPNGSEGWTRQFGTRGNEWPHGIAVDTRGDVYVAGDTDGAFPQQTNAGRVDVFVRQFKPNGTDGWTHQFGTGSADQSAGIAVDAAGDVYVAGSTLGAMSGKASAGDDFDAFVRQYRADGSEGWTRQFGTAESDILSGVAVGAGGDVVAAGSTRGAFPGLTNAGYADIVVRQLHADGTDGWTYEFGTADDDFTPSIAVGATGDVYLAGITYGALPGQTSTGDGDAFVVKLRPVDTPAANPATPVAPFPNSSARTYFPATGHSLAYGFKTYWERNGGLPVFGYPLTEEFSENERTVQYTERQRFEYHPEFQGTPYEVLLGRLGVTAAQRQHLLGTGTAAFQPLPAGTPSDANCTFFVATGHRLCSGFKAYWHSHGLDFGDPGVSFRESLALFGYPISEEYVDPSTGLVTQYFERAVFEYHPTNPEPYKVLLRRLGAKELQARGWMP